LRRRKVREESGEPTCKTGASRAAKPLCLKEIVVSSDGGEKMKKNLAFVLVL
jgi:hypothetical protein